VCHVVTQSIIQKKLAIRNRMLMVFDRTMKPQTTKGRPWNPLPSRHRSASYAQYSLGRPTTSSERSCVGAMARLGNGPDGPVVVAAIDRSPGLNGFAIGGKSSPPRGVRLSTVTNDLERC
jgi:hypothetical protein